MSIESNRLLMVWEKTLKEVNREIINPKFEVLKIDDLKPVIELVARSRAEFLEELFDIAEEFAKELPSEERIARLKQRRERFEELVAASRALEVAIERGYLDVTK